MTPKYLRAMANRFRTAAALGHVLEWRKAVEVDAALRTAADQLEAVQALHRHDIGGEFWVSATQLDAILTADTAPQEASNE